MNTKRPAFSEQIRSAIVNCGTTQYSLAKQIGISAAVLSRFVAGKQGMTLETLDKLARVLGLEVIQTIENVERPKPKGRKPAKDDAVVTATRTSEWKRLANLMAQDAHENYFSSRRGIWHMAGFDKLCVFNNNPYAKGKEFRDTELAEFRKRLKAEGIKELGFGEWPGDDDEDGQPGYTFAMILDCGEDRQEWIVDVWDELVSATMQRMA